jgi:uncharacterized protein
MSDANELELTRLFIYPIKSARGIEVTKARVLERGLEHDRRFMLVDSGGNLATARHHPKLLTVSTALSHDSLVISAPLMPDLRVPLEPQGEQRLVRVWFDWMPALVVGEGSSGWFSDFLGVPLSLVWMPDHSDRRMNPTFGPARLSFADGNPLHLVSESSLNDLEARLGTTVSVERFRPNLVVRGTQPYAEDHWAHLRIGALEFRPYEACARCMVVNLEPTTGEIGVEPLRTLAKYRRRGKLVVFGQHLYALDCGALQVGQGGIVTGNLLG